MLIRCLIVCLCWVFAGSWGIAHGQAPALDRLLELHALKVLPHNGDVDAARGVSIYIRQIGGEWKTGLLLAPSFNSNYHAIRVTDASETDGVLTLKIAADIQPDPWIKGGRARITFALSPETATAEKADVVGTFTCTLDGVTTTGKAGGWLMTLPEAAPAKPGEHPRLLFRRDDLRSLNKLAETPFGKAAIERMTTAAGLGMRYQLTGDEALATQARKMVETIMADNDSGDKGVAHRVWAWRAEEVALAYDLCYDAWDETFRAEVADYLAGIAERVFFNHGSFTEYSGWRLNDRIGVGLIYGPCFASLAFVGEKGSPPPPVPTDYLAGHDPRKALPPVQLDRPDKAPRSPFPDGKRPDHWLWVGPIPTTQAADLNLEHLAKSQLAAGQELTLLDKSFTVEPFPEKHFWGDKLDILGANKHAYYTSNILYTVIENDEPRWVRFTGSFSGATLTPTIYLAGVPIADGDVFRIGKGTYPLLVIVPVSQTNPWGKEGTKPTLTQIDEATAEKELPIRIAAAEDRRGDAQAAWQHYKKTGTSARYEKLFRISEGLMYATYRHTIGDGGFQHGYSDVNNLLVGPMRYASAYLRSQGRSPSPRPDISHILERRVWSVTRLDDGQPYIPPINGNADFDLQSWFESRDAANETFAALLAFYPSGYEVFSTSFSCWPGNVNPLEKRDRPLSADDYAPVLRGGRSHALAKGITDQSLAVWALPAVIPGMSIAAMPPTFDPFWRADTDGWYGFRLGEKSYPAEALVQVFAKQRLAQKWNRENAGAVRVSAFGHDWWVGPRDHDPAREFESAPLYEGPWFPDGRGKVLHADFDAKDHTGSVAIDLSELYMQKLTDDDVTDTYNGALTIPGTLKELGVRAKRIVGVDYSGKSGAPVLVVVVDQFENSASAHEWTFQLDSKREQYGRWSIIDAKGSKQNNNQIKKLREQTGSRSILPEGYEFKIARDAKVSENFEPTVRVDLHIDGDTFVIKKTGATLRAKLIGTEDKPLELNDDIRAILHKQLHGHSHGVDRIGSWAVRAKSKGDFICVLTIQPDAVDAPAIKVAGNGKDRQIHIGDRVVRVTDGAVEFE